MPSGAFGGADYRQTVTLALQAQGADSLTIVRDGIAAVQNQLGVLNQMQAEGLGPREYIKHLQTLGGELKKLQQMELGIVQTFEAGQRAKIDALAREERAVMEAAEAEKQAAGDAMRARIDAMARAERAREQFHRQAILDAGEAQRARIDAYAREDSAREQYHRKEILESGESMRARIEGYARAEQAQEKINAQSLADQQKYFSSINAMARGADNPLPKYFKDTQVATAGASGALGGFASQADMAAAKSRNMSFGLMSIAYAMDDVRYGIGAVINNVPMLAAAFGASPAWAASIAMVSIAVYEIGKAITPVAKQYMADVGLMTDHTKDMVVTVQDAKTKLEALEEKPYKLEVDYRAIDDATRQLDEMEKRLGAFNAAKGGDTQADMAKQAGAVARGYMGGSEGLFKAVAEQAIATGTAPITADQKWKREQYAFDVATYKRDVAAGQPWQQVNLDRAQLKLDEVNAEIAKAQGEHAQQQVGAFLRGEPAAIQRMQGMALAAPARFAAIGPGGLTAAEAIRDLPATVQEAARRAEAEAEDKRLQDTERDITAQYNKRKQRERKAANDLDQKIRQENQAEEASIDTAQESARLAARGQTKDAKTEAKEARDAARDARNAQLTPAQQKRQTEMGYGQEFQSRGRRLGIPISGDQATAAGRDIAGMVGQGADVDSAMQQALANLSSLVNRQNMTMLRSQAGWEQLNGIVGQATIQLQMIEMQQRRATINTRTNNVHP